MALQLSSSPHTPPPASAAIQIANALEKVAIKADSLGYRSLADSINSVVIEAIEEARHVSLITC